MTLKLTRPWLVTTAIAAVSAGILSGIPSTVWALTTDGDPWEATVAAGAAVVGTDAPFGRLLAAASVAHGRRRPVLSAGAGWPRPRYRQKPADGDSGGQVRLAISRETAEHGGV